MRRIVRLALSAAFGMLTLAACSSYNGSSPHPAPTTSAATSPSTPTASVSAGPAPTFCADAPAGSALAAANYPAQQQQSAAAVDLYTKLLALQNISIRDRDCAGQALAALTLAAPPAKPNDVQSVASDWDTFYAKWVAPGAVS